MKITIAQGAFFPVPPVRGGAVEKIWFALGQEFARRGHEVTHISRAFEGLPATERTGGVHHIRVAGYDTPRSLALLKLRDLCYTLRVLRNLPPADILVTHTFWLPMLVRSEQFGKIYVHAARYPKGQMRWYQHAARLQTVSRPIGEALLAEVPQCGERITCIPNPLPEMSSLPPVLQDPAEKRLLYVGRVHPEKGLHLLVEAIGMISEAAFDGWKLVVVGPAEVSAGGGGGDYLASLHRLAAGFSHRIEWVGAVYEPERLAAYYRSASLFIYPSLAERGETFGLAPLEAMAHGCPALVSNLACFGDFVEDKINGFVFDHRVAAPASLLSNEIARLIGASGGLEPARAAAASKAGEYTVDRIAGLYLHDFQSLSAASTPECENLRPEIVV